MKCYRYECNSSNNIKLIKFKENSLKNSKVLQIQLLNVLHIFYIRKVKGKEMSVIPMEAKHDLLWDFHEVIFQDDPRSIPRASLGRVHHGMV